MANFLDQITQEAKRKGISDAQKESREFFRKKVKELHGNIKPNEIMRDSPQSLRTSSQLGIGKLYFIFYDPKLKKELPYYDTFPLIIPIHYYSDGILGLNLHYLHPATRAKLLAKLMDVANNPKLPENRKMKISYGLLKNAAKYKEFKPCLKRYLFNHMRSRALMLNGDEWTSAIFLPVARFQKASATKVYSDSRKIIQGN